MPVRAVEQNIATLISNRGGRIRVTFPITGSVELASLLGHCFGDGCVPFKKRDFDYVNKDKALIVKVKDEVFAVFHSEPVAYQKQADGTFKLGFSNLIGDVLLLCGAPRGAKISNNQNYKKHS
jgi:hypothetical protein